MPRVITITIVNAPGCHYCQDAEEALGRFAEAYPIEVRRLDINSKPGQELIVEHRAGMNPLILVDGEYFSCGRLPRGKLGRLLESSRTSAMEPPVLAPEPAAGGTC